MVDRNSLKARVSATQHLSPNEKAAFHATIDRLGGEALADFDQKLIHYEQTEVDFETMAKPKRAEFVREFRQNLHKEDLRRLHDQEAALHEEDMTEAENLLSEL